MKKWIPIFLWQKSRRIFSYDLGISLRFGVWLLRNSEQSGCSDRVALESTKTQQGTRPMTCQVGDDPETQDDDVVMPPIELIKLNYTDE